MSVKTRVTIEIEGREPHTFEFDRAYIRFEMGHHREIDSLKFHSWAWKERESPGQRIEIVGTIGDADFDGVYDYEGTPIGTIRTLRKRNN